MIGTGFVRPVLWLLLVISGACDVVVSSMNVPVLVELPIGLCGLACAVALGVHHYRHRRR